MTYLTKYVSVNNVLDFLLNHMKMILADKLRGVYLFGSLVSGDFDENISDIDLMVAINGSLTDFELDALKQMHVNCASEFTDWNDRIEVAYITTDALKTFKVHPSVIAIISPGEPFHTKTAGIDWLINWYQIREQSEVLFGPTPSSLIAPISKDEYIQAVSDQLREWDEWVETSHTRGFQAYAILTMCRGMYAIRFGKQVSKLKAANWAEEQYPEWAKLIRTALKWRTDQLKEGKIEDSGAHVETVRFIHFAIEINNDQIELSDYDPQWPKMAQDEMERLKRILPGEHIIDIQHVGSTAIPGMIAKPIIDIQIAVDSLTTAKEFAIPILEANDYVYWYDNPDPERMFFVRGMPPFGEKRTHHVHMYELSCPQWSNKILFRDYLITHPEKARQYAALKIELSKKHTHDREKYTDAKKQFVEEILKMVECNE